MQSSRKPGFRKKNQTKRIYPRKKRSRTIKVPGVCSKETSGKVKGGSEGRKRRENSAASNNQAQVVKSRSVIHTNPPAEGWTRPQISENPERPQTPPARTQELRKRRHPTSFGVPSSSPKWDARLRAWLRGSGPHRYQKKKG